MQKVGISLKISEDQEYLDNLEELQQPRKRIMVHLFRITKQLIDSFIC